jgi:hypothetical protein
MKTILLFILLIFLNSDTVIYNTEIEIILKNEEIYFIETDSEAETYSNEEEKDKSFNLIEIQLRNNSNRKLILFIDPTNFNFQNENPFTGKKYSEYTHLIENNNKIVRVNQVLVSFSEFPIGLYNLENHESNIRKKKYESLGLSKEEIPAYELYENYSLSLGPNESKTLYFSLNLPIEAEINPKILQNPVRYNKLEEGWDFRFVYCANSKNIYEDLPRFLKEELKENKFEIFDDTIYSNAVKLKRR